jgi:hypothetical protein
MQRCLSKLPHEFVESLRGRKGRRSQLNPYRVVVLIVVSAGMGTKLRALDDLDIEIQVTWPSVKVIVLEQAQAYWWLSMDQWVDELERWRQAMRTWEVSAVVSLRLGLAYQ